VTYLPVGREGLVDVEALKAAITDKTILISVISRITRSARFSPSPRSAAGQGAGSSSIRTRRRRWARFRERRGHGDRPALGHRPPHVRAQGSGKPLRSAQESSGPPGRHDGRRRPRARLRSAPCPCRWSSDSQSAEICRGGDGGGRKAPGRSARPAAGPLLSKVDEAYVNGHPSNRLPHNLNISSLCRGESVLMGLNKESALSSGSACTSSTLERRSNRGSRRGTRNWPIPRSLWAASILDRGRSRLRGRRVVEVVHRLREMSPLYELAKKT